MLYRAASERREFALSSAASFQLLVGQRREARGGPDRELRVRPPRPRGGRGAIDDAPIIRLPRSIRFTNSTATPLQSGDERDAARETAITQQLERQGLSVAEVVAIERSLRDDPLIASLED